MADMHWTKIEIIQREAFLKSCELGVETARNIREEYKKEAFNL